MKMIQVDSDEIDGRINALQQMLMEAQMATVLAKGQLATLQAQYADATEKLTQTITLNVELQAKLDALKLDALDALKQEDNVALGGEHA